MSEETAFLDAILAAPDDLTARLVYADWLDDRADPRAEYLRLRTKITGEPDSAERTRLRELQAGLPTWWLTVVGFHAAPQEPDPARIEEVARLLGRQVQYTDTDGYEISIHAAAISGLHGAVAYLEERSRWLDRFHDIRYHLRLRAADGQEASCEPYTYNPFFGCRPRFLEWYGDTALMIYGEKHGTYACRFGFGGPSSHHELTYQWVVNGREIGFRKYGETRILRLAVPDLAELPPLTEDEASERGLLPPGR